MQEALSCPACHWTTYTEHLVALTVAVTEECLLLVLCLQPGSGPCSKERKDGDTRG